MRSARARKSLLERGGDMLEHVPEAIRPKIRRRDRRAPWRDVAASDLPDGASLDPGKVIEAETDHGPLLLEKDAVILTRELLETRSYDRAIGGLIRHTLRPGSTFVDAGANIGYFTVLASRVVGQSGRVYAIEPDPVNLSILRTNLARQGCSNTTVLPVAAWSERRELSIVRQPTEGATARVGAKLEGGRPIPAAPLDELIEGPVDFIKIDTELTDHHVVTGSQRLIAQNPSMLMTVEFCPWDETQNGESPAEVLGVYKRLGLAPFEISENGAGVKPTTYESLSSPTLPEGHVSVDFALSMRLPDRLLWMEGPVEKAKDLPGRIGRKLRRGNRQPAQRQSPSNST